tara:strand:- start:62 stop:193 length:132 start_codon:yes stop_codon:yes gene_type:complete
MPMTTSIGISLEKTILVAKETGKKVLGFPVQWKDIIKNTISYS